MEIRGAERADIEAALAKANEVFGGNIQFKRFDFDRNSPTWGPTYQVTLTVLDSRGPGSKESASGSGRRVAACCFHVFGVFMDALPADCRIKTASPGGRMIVSPGDSWDARDGQVGSMMYPVWASELCDCDPWSF